MPQQEPVRPPRPVAVSFWLWVASGGVLIAGFAATLLTKDALIAELVARDSGGGITAERIASGVTQALWMLLIGGIIYALLMALFAYKAREGTRSARTVLTVLAALLVAAQLTVFRNIVTLAASLLALAAMVLMYLPSVTGYFPPAARGSGWRR